MSGRQTLLYFAWNRAGETGAPLAEIDDRFPALFELRRLFYPTYESLADLASIDQGIAGFLDHVQKPNFAAFVEHAQAQTGGAVVQVERGADDGAITRLDNALIDGVDTIIVISFNSLRTEQIADEVEIAAVEQFLSHPDHLLFVCPHHDIGEVADGAPDQRQSLQLAEHLHHGDRASPPRQGFSGFARTLLAGLGVPIENRFGLRPAANADGSPGPIEVDRASDAWDLLDGVETFNLHPHLPHLERLDASLTRMQVLARQRIDPAAPPHPFTREGRMHFDALLQSAPHAFAAKLLVCDTTLFSGTAGGLESLHRLWSNIAQRPQRS